MYIADLDTLKDQIEGEVIEPGDAAYEQASGDFAHKGSPAVIVRPQSVNDVIAAIKYAREEQMVLSVRSGGHGGVGFATNDGGLVIDLSAMRAIDVDEQARLVHVGGGATWGHIADTLRDHGLAITSGDTVSVGVGGLTLGGGIGWMVRKYGLALDQLKEVEIVTADGKVLTANETQHSDLFWGVRGAGANFGVVTRFTFEAQPIRKVFWGTVTADPDKLEALLPAWRDCMRKAPEELNTTLAVMPPMGPNPASMQLLVCYADDDEAAAQAAFEPLQNLPGVTKHEWKLVDYADVLEEAPHPPPDIEVGVHNAFVNDFSDEFIKKFVTLEEQVPTAMLMVRYIGNGALNRVPSDATAFGHRDTEIMVILAAFFTPDAPAEAKTTLHDAWSKIESAAMGSYCNFLSEGTSKEVALIYPPQTMQRLQKLKKQYDPQNLFKRNFNILPE